MSTDAMSTLFALLAFLSLAIAFAVPVLAAVRPEARALVGDLTLYLPAAIAATAMLGSLYYSENALFEPCLLCWWQRIFMYPLAILLPLGLLFRRPVDAWQPFVLSLIGGLIALYHYWLQVRPTESSICDIDNPCSLRWVETFGFVSIPFMALCGFAAIASLSATRIWLDQSNGRETDS